MFILSASQRILVSSPRKVWKERHECSQIIYIYNFQLLIRLSIPTLDGWHTNPTCKTMRLSLNFHPTRYNFHYATLATFYWLQLSTLNRFQLSPNFTTFNFHTTFGHTPAIWNPGGKPGSIPRPIPNWEFEAESGCWWVNNRRGWSDVEKSTFPGAWSTAGCHFGKMLLCRAVYLRYRYNTVRANTDGITEVLCLK